MTLTPQPCHVKEAFRKMNQYLAHHEDEALSNRIKKKCYYYSKAILNMWKSILFLFFYTTATKWALRTKLLLIIWLYYFTISEDSKYSTVLSLWILFYFQRCSKKNKSSTCFWDDRTFHLTMTSLHTSALKEYLFKTIQADCKVIFDRERLQLEKKKVCKMLPLVVAFNSCPSLLFHLTESDLVWLITSTVISI